MTVTISQVVIKAIKKELSSINVNMFGNITNSNGEHKNCI